MRVTVNTNEYQWSHGKKPRGYGGWFFYTKHDGPGTTYVMGMPDNLTLLTHGTGLFSAMKKEAVEMAKLEGKTEVIVGS